MWCRLNALEVCTVFFTIIRKLILIFLPNSNLDNYILPTWVPPFCFNQSSVSIAAKTLAVIYRYSPQWLCMAAIYCRSSAILKSQVIVVKWFLHKVVWNCVKWKLLWYKHFRYLFLKRIADTELICTALNTGQLCFLFLNPRCLQA